MASEEYQWHINTIKDRYQYLDVSFEQAEKINYYEQDLHISSATHFFSPWEQWDYELVTFKEILTPEQFINYETSLKTQIQGYEQSLVEMDNGKANDIAYHEELVQFYETLFVPDLFKNIYATFSWLSTSRVKINFLKAAYKQYLNETKKEILINHFRYNRTFMPNGLKLSLLYHRLSYIWPSYASFKHRMDEPTKAIATYLEVKASSLPEPVKELLTRKQQELNQFAETCREKYYKNRGGWNTTIYQLSAEEEMKNQTMSLLLLDREKYKH